jgi:hypothetical protein
MVIMSTSGGIIQPTDAWRRNFSGRGGAAGQPDRCRFDRGAGRAVSGGLAFLTAWGQSCASGCRSINHCELGARKPYGARLFGVFALVQIGFKFPFGERRIGEFSLSDGIVLEFIDLTSYSGTA